MLIHHHKLKEIHLYGCRNRPKKTHKSSLLIQLTSLPFSHLRRSYDDLHFIVNIGLSAEDLNCIGMPMSRLGLRHKLTALHNARAFLGRQQNYEHGGRQITGGGYESSPDNTESSSGSFSSTNIYPSY